MKSKNEVKREVIRSISAPQIPGVSNVRRARLLGRKKRMEDFFPLKKHSSSGQVSVQQQFMVVAEKDNKDTKHSLIHHDEKRNRQLYLDFGQKSFAKHMICFRCGMLLVHGVNEDVQAHERICKDYKDGLFFRGWEKERVIWRSNTCPNGNVERIIEIRSSDPLRQQRKVDQIKRVIDQEMGFCPSAMSWLSGDLRNNSRRCLLYVSSQRRVIGLCIIEKISTAFPLLLDSSKPFKHQHDTLGDNANPSTPLCLERSNDSCPASLGIYQIWCHSKYRRAGISRRMVDAARSTAYFGFSVPLSHLAFSSPTADGISFARNYCGSATPLLVYDI